VKFLSRIYLSILLLIPVTLFAQDLSKLTFEKFTSKEGKYSVMFPGKPQLQQQKANTELGDIEITMNVLAIGNDMAFIVSHNDYPDAVKNADPGQMLEGARNGNKGKDGEIVTDEAIKFGPEKLPGRRFLIKKPGDIYMKNMIIFKGTRLYQVMLIGKKDVVESKDADKYYKSFELTK
jgi:hypothetical protein